MQRGRPTTYTEEKAAEICEAIRTGTSPGGTWDKLKISPATVRSWQKQHPDFDDEYREAVEIYWKRQFDFMDAEARNTMNDFINDKANMAAVKRSELIVNTIKARAEMMCPDKYGAKRKDWLHDCPEFGEKMSAIDRLHLINKLLSQKKVSVQNALILAQITDIQLKCEDVAKLSAEVAEIKKLISQHK